MSKTANSAVVKREPSSQRRHYRLTAPAAVNIDGVEHKISDWGLGGFSVDPFDGAPLLGEIVDVQFFLNFQGFEISFQAQAEIVHRNRYRIGARFIRLGQREEALLKYFASKVISGEMVEVGDALTRVDRPVTPAAGIAKPHSLEQKQRHSVARVLIASAYIFVGLILGGYLLVTLVSHLSRVDVQTAVINSGIEQVVSRDLGHVVEVYVQPGAHVVAGTPLLKVEDDQVAQWVATASQNVGIMRARLHDAQGRRALAEKKFQVYQSISSYQLSSARAEVTARTAERDAEKLQIDRIKALVDEGIAAPRVYDQEKAVLAAKQGALDHAVEDLKIVESGAKATDGGLMFSANYLVGDLATLQSEVANAAEQVRVAEATLNQALQRQSELVYRAPYTGTVVRMYKSAGMTVDRGEEIMVLTHGSGERTIDAYLTQDEAAYIQTGAHGVAYVPGTGKRYNVEVVSVDRTRGFVKELETPRPLQPGYNWRGVEDKSAYVQLVFTSVSDRDSQELAGGMPVFVNLPKKAYLPIMSMFGGINDGKGQNTSKGPDQSRQRDPKAKSTGISFQMIPEAAAATRSEGAATALWRANSTFIRDPKALRADTEFDAVRSEVLDEAKKALREAPSPVQTLRSSGVTDKNDPSFQATRRAFSDADKFALLAIAHRLSGDTQYLDGARRYALAWAEINKPTGEPIDETRLDGFLWGLDLVRSEFSPDENQKINRWLEGWLAAKRAFKLGSISATNNHKTHQLKIILLLDKLLNRSDDYKRDLAEVEKQLDANLLPDGESIDYQQRDAMHYHIYDLEAWNEIALVTGCCGERIDRAFAFFQNTIAKDPNHVEFANSTAPIDGKRAEAGFEYAKAKSFDVHEAARAIYSYATLPGRKVSNDLWQAAIEGKARKNLFYLARYYLWSTN